MILLIVTFWISARTLFFYSCFFDNNNSNACGRENLHSCMRGERSIQYTIKLRWFSLFKFSLSMITGFDWYNIFIYLACPFSSPSYLCNSIIIFFSYRTYTLTCSMNEKNPDNLTTFRLLASASLFDIIMRTKKIQIILINI